MSSAYIIPVAVVDAVDGRGENRQGKNDEQEARERVGKKRIENWE